jgi:hypothetical protein
VTLPEQYPDNQAMEYLTDVSVYVIVPETEPLRPYFGSLEGINADPQVNGDIMNRIHKPESVPVWICKWKRHGGRNADMRHPFCLVQSMSQKADGKPCLLILGGFQQRWQADAAKRALGRFKQGTTHVFAKSELSQDVHITDQPIGCFAEER